MVENSKDLSEPVPVLYLKDPDVTRPIIEVLTIKVKKRRRRLQFVPPQKTTVLPVLLKKTKKVSAKIKSFFKYWLWPFLYTGLIFGFSSLPPSALPKIQIIHFDKFLHFIEYGILGYLLARAFYATTKLEYKNILWFILATAFIIAAADEKFQSFIPGRDSSVFDLIFDMMGVLCGLIIYRKAGYDKNKAL